MVPYLILEVKHVEADLEDLDLVSLEAGSILDGLEVDPLERLWFLRHPDFRLFFRFVGGGSDVEG